MKIALKYLETHSVPTTDEDGIDTTEDVSLADAKYAVKLAVLELCQDMRSMDFGHMRAKVEDELRTLNKERISF